MTQRRFLDLLRQYASQAQRRSTSYAGVVAKLRELRLEAILTDDMSPQERAAEIARVDGMVAREYGKHDHEWDTPV